MKHSLSGLLLALTLIAQPAAALAIAGGPTLAAQSSSNNVAVNSQFTVTIPMDTKSYQVSAAELHLTFPADKLQALSITKGTFLPNELAAGAVGSGTASIILGSGTQPVMGIGPVATVTFRALAPGSATIGFAGNTAVAAVGQTGNVVDSMTAATLTIAAAVAGIPAGAVATPSVVDIGQVSQVSTGPFESTLVALIVGCIITLLYVGYVGSDSFRHNEAVSIAKEESGKTPDFRDR